MNTTNPRVGILAYGSLINDPGVEIEPLIVERIPDTFPIVKRKDEAKFGDYRTKLVILKIYDAMKSAMASGQPYQTLLNPPPASLRCCHPPRPDQPKHEVQIPT